MMKHKKRILLIAFYLQIIKIVIDYFMLWSLYNVFEKFQKNI